MLRKFWNDESGFIVSSELVLIATICVIGMIVGLVEVQWAVVGELNDVGDAIGSLNQSFQFAGFTDFKTFPGSANTIKARRRVDFHRHRRGMRQQPVHDRLRYADSRNSQGDLAKQQMWVESLSSLALSVVRNYNHVASSVD
jgi:Flp pilus assembly pilin Flp